VNGAAIKAALVGALVVASAAGPLAIRHWQRVQSRQKEEALRQQAARLAELGKPEPGEEVRSNPVPVLSHEQLGELLRLRGQVGVLRAQLAEAAERADGNAMRQRYAGPVAQMDGDKTPNLSERYLLGKFFVSQSSQSNSADGLGFPWALAPARSDAAPLAALLLALHGQLGPAERRSLLESNLATWAKTDTDAALQWVEGHLSEPGEKDAALSAIQSVAPVGIGAELKEQHGHVVINRLFPGSPAQLSGQIHPGDRILAVAQGDNIFADARALALSELVQRIRGAPGTLIQLQVLPADAPPDSQPSTVTLSRNQVKFNQ